MAKRVAAVAAAAVASGLAGGCNGYKQPPEPWPNVPQSAPDRGQALYQQSCASCHGPTGQGTAIAPSLHGIGSAAVDFNLSTGRMPLSVGEKYRANHQTSKFNAQDINAIVGYVAQLQPGGPPIPDVHPTNVQLGRALYAANCAACHSAAGAGGTLTGGRAAPDLYKATPTQIGEAIRTGPGLMPTFPDTVLNSEQVNAIAAYVQTLQSHHDIGHGGVSLGRIGPVTEGLLAWIVALPILMLVARRLGSKAR
jgi:ubiquinol-cytochrome c reductase cytochrome c subunit